MRSVATAASVLIFTLGVPATGSAESQAAQADAAWQSQQWTAARDLYAQLVRNQPSSYLYWIRLATAFHRTARDREALTALKHAEDTGAPASVVQYQLALVRASLRDVPGALTALEKAVQEGRGRPDLIREAPELSALQGDARFSRIVQQAERNQSPCEHAAQSRQFDFWIGDWDVSTTREHTTAGTSHIERTLGSCVIWENWTSAGESRYVGKSYNVYNDVQHRWEQFWVDNQGGMIHFTGTLQQGVMDFRTEDVQQPDGKTLLRHLRFFPVDSRTVRQLSEGSSDGGSTWQTEYDFTYTRRE